MSGFGRSSTLIFGTLTALALSGCQREGSRIWLDAPHGVHHNAVVRLFGDEPDAESVPFGGDQVLGLTQHTFTHVGLDFDPDVCAAADLLVFASTRGSDHPDLYLKSIDGAAVTRLTSDAADHVQPRFSPDGARIAFCSDATGNWDIWIMNRDGSDALPLTDDPADEIAPCWSPDGTHIALTRWNKRCSEWEIITVPLAAPTEWRRVTSGLSPVWSPDGGTLAFQRQREPGCRRFSIWTVGLGGNEVDKPSEIAHEISANCVSPRWSYSGTAIIYAVIPDAAQFLDWNMHTPESATLWTVDVRDGRHARLVDVGGACVSPACARDGRVFFVSSRDGTANIWSSKVALGRTTSGLRESGASADKSVDVIYVRGSN